MNDIQLIVGLLAGLIWFAYLLDQVVNPMPYLDKRLAKKLRMAGYMAISAFLIVAFS